MKVPINKGEIFVVRFLAVGFLLDVQHRSCPDVGPHLRFEVLLNPCFSSFQVSPHLFL